MFVPFETLTITEESFEEPNEESRGIHGGEPRWSLEIPQVKRPLGEMSMASWSDDRWVLLLLGRFLLDRHVDDWYVPK